MSLSNQLELQELSSLPINWNREFHVFKLIFVNLSQRINILGLGASSSNKFDKIDVWYIFWISGLADSTYSVDVKIEHHITDFLLIDERLLDKQWMPRWAFCMKDSRIT